MSAFMCSDTHLTALAAYAVRNGLSGIVHSTRENDVRAMVGEVYGVLYRENLASLDARYPGDDTPTIPGQVDPRAMVTEYDLVSIIKQCHCYAYQACEHTGWERSRAKALVETIEAHAVRKLPGYDAAPWGL